MEKQSIFITTRPERQRYVKQVTRIARLFYRLSCKERREDALALRADERRNKPVSYTHLITAIAVTYGPGLVGALLVGVAEAKACLLYTSRCV